MLLRLIGGVALMACVGCVADPPQRIEAPRDPGTRGSLVYSCEYGFSFEMSYCKVEERL